MSGHFTNRLHATLADAVRILRARPLRTAAVILTLGIGTTALTTVFAVAAPVLFRSLPYFSAQELVVVRGVDPNTGKEWDSVPPEVVEYLNGTGLLASVARYDVVPRRRNVHVERSNPQVNVAHGSKSLLGVLGASTLRGPGCGSQTQSPGDEAVISYAFWVTTLGAREDVLGSTLTFENGTVSVVGVLPREFWYPRALPGDEPQVLLCRESLPLANAIYVIGRLKERTTLNAVAAQMQTAATGLSESGVTPSGSTLTVESLDRVVFGTRRPAFILLFGAAGCLLLIASANVAASQMGLVMLGQRDLAIRMALGASYRQIVSLLFAQAALIAIPGALLGLIGARLLAPVVFSGLPARTTAGLTPHVDLRVFGFCVVTMAIVTIVATVGPAALWSSQRLTARLTNSGRYRSSNALRAQTILVVADVALGICVMAMAASLARTAVAMGQIDLGFSPAEVIVAHVDLPRDQYREPTRVMDFFDAASESLTTIPGVTGVALADMQPLSNASAAARVTVDGESQTIDIRRVSPSYVQVMGATIQSGRALTSEDSQFGACRAMANRRLAATLGGPDVALTRQFALNKGVTCEIVGVISDMREMSPREAPTATLYVPFSDPAYRRFASRTLLLKSRDVSPQMRALIREQILRLEPNLVISPSLLSDAAYRYRAEESVYAWVVMIIAVFAVILTAIGVWSLIVSAIAARESDLAIRYVLGASLWLVVAVCCRRITAAAVVGLCLGLAIATSATRLLSAALPTVSTDSGGLLALVVATMASVTIAAAIMPVRQLTTRVSKATVRSLASL